MTEPVERPGSDDPEDPSELQRLIGRTVPRSPHAGARRSVGDSASPGSADDPADDPAVQPAGERSAAGSRADEARPDGASVEGAPADDAADEASADGAPADGAPAHDVPAEETSADEASSDASPIDGVAAGTPPTRDGEEPIDPVDELADDTDLEHALEALLLVVDSPVDEASLAATLDQPASRIRATLHRMSVAYTADARGIDLRRAGGGWRFYTRDRYAPYVEKMLLDGQRARLTRAALETLAVVAYRQPVTRARVSAVRGVNCDGVLRTLLTRGLVEEAGAEEQTGGTLFRTTELFLERLGLSSVAELPPLAPLLPDIDAIDDLDGS
ncbi:SMC-Scp complex subunit ScpB [Pseudonocardia nantongensis]|uniref:SMC-Scp complex subunit ScpB n=1 Tax=Pseudonocardia nantongensis TaxID=1181885 RepID=UPI003979C540